MCGCVAYNGVNWRKSPDTNPGQKTLLSTIRKTNRGSDRVIFEESWLTSDRKPLPINPSSSSTGSALMLPGSKRHFPLARRLKPVSPRWRPCLASVAGRQDGEGPAGGRKERICFTGTARHLDLELASWLQRVYSMCG